MTKKVTLLILIIFSVIQPLHAASFKFQHGLIFPDQAGIYPGFTVNVSGANKDYCSFYGYLGDVGITPMFLDGSPAEPLRPPFELPNPVRNTIYDQKEQALVGYVIFDFSGAETEKFDVVTSIRSRIEERRNSHLIATCRVPTQFIGGKWVPIAPVPTLSELREMFKDQFTIIAQ